MTCTHNATRLGARASWRDLTLYRDKISPCIVYFMKRTTVMSQVWDVAQKEAAIKTIFLAGYNYHYSM